MCRICAEQVDECGHSSRVETANGLGCKPGPSIVRLSAPAGNLSATRTPTSRWGRYCFPFFSRYTTYMSTATAQAAPNFSLIR
jgi:hypothetical protein